MSKYTHTFDLCFNVTTDSDDPFDVTAEELRGGILRRMANIQIDEYEEACGYVDSAEEIEVETIEKQPPKKEW
jgi:hypothetical protein